MKISTDLYRQLELCSVCPGMCRYSCPVHNQEFSEAATPSFLNRMHKTAIDSKDISRLFKNINAFCIDCGNCTSACNHRIQTGILMSEWRSEQNPQPYHAPDFDNLIKIYQKFPQHFFSRGALKVLFPGEQTIRHNPSSVLSFFKLMDLSGLECSLLDTDCISSGYENWIKGDYSSFDKIEKVNLRIYGNYRQIIFLDPVDLYVFKNLYKNKFSASTELLYWSDFIDENFYNNINDIDGIQSRMWFKPCILRNRIKIQSLEKLISRLGIKVVEENLCCGGHGYLVGTEEKIINKMGNKIISKALGLNASSLLTSCVLCKNTLQKISPLPIIDLIDLILDLFENKKHNQFS